MTKQQPPTADHRRLEARIDRLRDQVSELSEDNRHLHRQLATVIRHLAGEPCGDADEALPAAAPAPDEPGWIGRKARAVLRGAASLVRSVRRATDPGAEDVRTLVVAADPSPPDRWPALGSDLVLDPPDAIAPDSPGGRALVRLFGLEDIDAAWFRGPDGDVLCLRSPVAEVVSGRNRSILLTAARTLRRPILAKDAPGPPPPDGSRCLLHPALDQPDALVWRRAPYFAGLPEGCRRVDLRLKTHAPSTDAQPLDLLLLVTVPLVEGLEDRVARILDLAAERRVGVVSTAGWTEAGARRLARLETPRCRVDDFGGVLHPATWAPALRSLLEAANPPVLWAIGTQEDLGPWVELAREVRPGVKIIVEPTTGDAARLRADRIVVRTESERQRLAGTPGIGALHLAPTPLHPVAPAAPSSVRRVLGVPEDASLVVVTGDLTEGSRAEDAAALARRLDARKDIHVRVVGRGPLAPVVDDLGRLFGLNRFAVVDSDHSVDEVVAAADVVCCPGSSNVLPRSANAALAAGTPVVGPSDGELVDLAASGTGTVVLAGAVGEVDRLAEAVLRAIDDPAKSSPTDGDATRRRADFTESLRGALDEAP